MQQRHGFKLALLAEQELRAHEPASAVDDHARANDVVMLAQASMAPAAALVRRSDVEVLTSPDLGVRAALALLDRNAEALPRAARGDCDDAEVDSSAWTGR